MKNRELIEKLQQWDPELEVFVYDVDYGYDPADPELRTEKLPGFRPKAPDDSRPETFIRF